MNPFEAHGIEHLSPSSCNTFIASPAMFVLQKCLKRSMPVGAAAFRGTAVEHGVSLGLNGTSEADAIKAAQDNFSALSALSSDPRRDKEADSIADMVKVALAELRGYGPPTSSQGHVSYEVEGLAVPLIGYYDFEWENHGVLTDLKTSHALPSAIKINHARQVALYRAARGDNLSARVTYVTSKKSATYALENPREHIATLGKIALAVQKFLSVSSDPMELASMVVPDVDSFYFNDPASRQAAFDIWGI